jgi:predicted TIM-barrel fold metal-dependent hydrolase
MVELEASGFGVARHRVKEQLIAAHQDHDGRQMMSRADSADVDMMVVLLPDLTYALKSELTIEEMYREHRDTLQRYAPRIEVFAGVDPRWGKDGLDLFVRGILEFGFSGMKLYPPCGYALNDRALDPYYEFCDEHRVPVLTHIGATSPSLSFEFSRALSLDGPAKRYANIPFILAHGAVSDTEACIELCKFRPNVYLDLSGAQSLATHARGVDRLTQLFTSGINHKIIFGTDWPIHLQASVNARLLDTIAAPGAPKTYMSEAHGALIRSGNIDRILARARSARGGAAATRSDS